jgi:Flp pilus assembly pilin Flp
MPISSSFSFARQDNGATAPEYALLIALIAAVIAASVGTIGNKLVQIFSDAAGWF